MQECAVRHQTPRVACKKGVAYGAYVRQALRVGQTGRCLYERLREHKCQKKVLNFEIIAKPARRRIVSPASVAYRRSREKTECQLVEAFHIKKRGDDCISKTSVVLPRGEAVFIRVYKQVNARGPRLGAWIKKLV